MTKSRENTKNAYGKAALKCLLDYEDPAAKDIQTQMCYNGLCPNGRCEFAGGKAEGENCGHVLAVKILTSRIRYVIMGD